MVAWESRNKIVRGAKTQWNIIRVCRVSTYEWVSWPVVSLIKYSSVERVEKTPDPLGHLLTCQWSIVSFTLLLLKCQLRFPILYFSTFIDNCGIDYFYVIRKRQMQFYGDFNFPNIKRDITSLKKKNTYILIYSRISTR